MSKTLLPALTVHDKGGVIPRSTELLVHGKVIDYAVMCKVCRGCKYWQSKENTPLYNEWKRYHNCSINHKGRAGYMEVSGVKAMILRSVSDRNLRYTTYLGDGDCKSHQEVVNLRPYLDHDIVTEEYIGHVQKKEWVLDSEHIGNSTKVSSCTIRRNSAA